MTWFHPDNGSSALRDERIPLQLDDDGDRTAGWTFHELDYVRREARVEAELAYEGWRQAPGRDGYAVYRAAQDRCDAAEDELARWVRGGRDARSPGPGPR